MLSQDSNRRSSRMNTFAFLEYSPHFHEAKELFDPSIKCVIRSIYLANVQSLKFGIREVGKGQISTLNR